MVGYTAAALGMRTPAYRGEMRKTLGNVIERLLDRRTWAYSDRYWRATAGDPCAQENIMYSGHLLHLLALYEAWTGESHYRTQGFAFVSGENRVAYTTMTLAERIAAEMRANASGGVCCEPGLIFFPCNNHPQAALLLLEKLGLGEWADERRKWEEWSLASFRAKIGDGLLRLFYHQPTTAFYPMGLPGGDGWSLLWYAPWASDLERPRRLWEEVRDGLDFKALLPEMPSEILPGAKDPRDPSLGGGFFAPLPPTVVFLAAAARACGDAESAARMEAWLDQRYWREEGGAAWLGVEPQWRIAVTALRALSLALENGSDLRRLTQAPPPRSEFSLPAIESVLPSSLSVRQAYRDGSRLMVELWQPGEAAIADATLELAHVAGVKAVEPLGAEDWSFRNGRLHLKNPGSRLLAIEVVPATAGEGGVATR